MNRAHYHPVQSRKTVKYSHSETRVLPTNVIVDDNEDIMALSPAC